MALVVGILGPFQVFADGVEVTPRAAKERALLAVLVLNRGRVVSAERLVEELWPDLPADRARHVLQVRIVGLRKLFDEASAGSAVRFVKPGYRVDVTAVDVDSDRFFSLAAGARDQLQQGDLDAASESLRNALALWRGAPLADVQACLSVEAEAARLAEQYCDLVEEYAELELMRGRHHEWVSPLEAMVSEEPFRERRWALLMLALYRCGRQVDSLRAFQRVRRRLDEVGLQPGPELRSLERLVSADDEALAVHTAPPASTGLTDASATLDGHRANQPAGLTQFRVNVDVATGNLPVQLTSFVGRDTELKAVAEQVRVHRLVTLTGVGGVGKTRLALQVAAERVTDFPDGAWLIELAPIGDPAAVPDAVANALGVTPQAGLTVTASIVQALSGRRLLIVLDNCEHVLDAAAAVVEAVLAGTSTVKVIATSREGLRLGAERRSPVPSLDVHAGAASAAVELFVERVQAVVAAFDLHDDVEATAVTEICRRLDGIALAIELAAARMVSMNPIEMLERLTDRFRLLSGPRRGLERHQTLHHAVGWSYDLLNDDQRRVLDRCSVFADGFDLAAATHVCGGDTVDEYTILDILDSLVRKSLVTTDRANSHTRYGLLETIRQFAEQHLAVTDTVDDIRDRHARYFADQAIAHWAQWDGPSQRVAVDWVDVEFANLRAGFRWAADRDDLDTATAIAAHSAVLAWVLPRYEAVGWAEEILEAAAKADVRQLPRLYTAASLSCYAGRPEAAVGYAHTAVVLDRDTRYNPFDPGWTGFWEAVAHIYTGQLDRTVDIGTTLAREPGLSRIAGLCVLSAGLPAVGRAEEAATIAEETVTAARNHGNAAFIALALLSYGRAFAQRDPIRALAVLREGLVFVRDHRILFLESVLARETAELEAVHGDLEQGLDLFDTVIDAFHRRGEIGNADTAFAHLAVLFDRFDRPQIAATLYGTSSHHGDLAWVVNLPHALDHLRIALGEPEFDRYVAAGAAMDFADAVRYAHDQIQLARDELTNSRRVDRTCNQTTERAAP